MFCHILQTRIEKLHVYSAEIDCCLYTQTYIDRYRYILLFWKQAFYRLWCVLIGIFSLGVPVDALFFIGNQLVATSHTGKVGVWNAVTQHWQVC